MKQALSFADSYFDKDFRPVLIFFVGRHQKIARKNGHKAVAFGFKVDRSIATQKTAQGLERWVTSVISTVDLPSVFL